MKYEELKLIDRLHCKYELQFICDLEDNQPITIFVKSWYPTKNGVVYYDLADNRFEENEMTLFNVIKH